MSPKAMTCSLDTSSRSQSTARVVALVTPAALISSNAEVDDQVTTARSPTADSARSQNSRDSSCSCRASSLSAGRWYSSGSGPRRLPSGIGWRSMNSGSSAIPSRVSTANAEPGTASRIRRQTSSPTSTRSVRSRSTRPLATSQTSAPLETTARPWWPTYSKTSSAQRSGRPVTNTTGTPPSSSAAITSRVYGEMVPSVRTRVPSRSVATRRGTRVEVTARRTADGPAGSWKPATQLDRDAVVVDGRGDVVGRGPRLLHGLAHGHAAARPAQHLDVVAAVADGQHVGLTDAEPLRDDREPGGLGDPDRTEVQPRRPAHDVVGAVQTEPTRKLHEVVGGG